MSPSDKHQEQAAAAAWQASLRNNHPDDDMEDDSKTFPMKLVEILADERYHEAICWLPHGRAFIIRNRKLFAETVMPLHFSRKAKYSSFTRKLNRWNFVRVSSGPEIGAYYHEFFLRDKPHLAAQMFCKNARTKLAMADETTPKPTGVVSSAQKSLSSNDATALATCSSSLQPSMVAAAAKVQPELAESSLLAAQQQQHQLAQFPPGLLSILQQDPDECCDKFPSMNMANNLQLLERQMQFLQEEHAQRLLLQRMAANRMMQQQGGVAGPMQFQQQQQQANMAAAMASSSSPHMMQQQQQQQAAQLMRMRQMMELRNRQRQGLAPTNPRASAA